MSFSRISLTGCLLAFSVAICSCASAQVADEKVTDTAQAAAVTKTETVERTAFETPSATITGTATAIAVKKVTEVKTPAAVKTPAKTAVKTGAKEAKTPRGSGDPKIDELIEKVRKASSDKVAMKAKITIKTSMTGTEPQTIKGNLIVRKTDRFRVNYLEPSEQVMVSNGKTIWVYTPALNQVIKQSVENANVNAKLYIQMEDSLKLFTSKSRNTLTEDDTFYTLDMVPVNRKELDYEEITVKIRKADYVPVYTGMKYDGTLMEAEFSDIENFTAEEAAKQEDLNASNFEFKAPAGAEVMDASELMQGMTK
ncbi:MAG: outer-membrane lipoprotein carrier protein LolA [Spirochaetia bacterium]|nr:outer-membrane lipoprotein carrier protein LolA [Spirochaetia bacterium]